MVIDPIETCHPTARSVLSILICDYIAGYEMTIIHMKKEQQTGDMGYHT